jgi:hypothetical protein
MDHDLCAQRGFSMKFLIEEILTERYLGVNLRGIVCALCINGLAFASPIKADQTHRKTSHIPAESIATAHATSQPEAKAQVAAPLTNVNAKPATVTLSDGILTVEANNSELSQILKAIGDVSGMAIDGSIRSVRVFGVYGPSKSRDVLTDLLTGLGYNFMMVGATHAGTPQQLQVTPRSGGSAPMPPPTPLAVVPDHRENSDGSVHIEEYLGPGAVAHIPPAPPEDQRDRTAQHLQRQQQMRDQMLQQNTPR